MIRENRSRRRMNSRYGSRCDEDHSKGFGLDVYKRQAISSMLMTLITWIMLLLPSL